MKNLFLVMVFLSTLQAGEIKIAVAANVSYAIEALKKAFESSHPNTQLQVTLGSSGKLTTQIKHGAPYQLFMSADMRYPTSLYHDKLAITKPVIYAKGALALLSTKNINFSKGIQIVQETSIKTMAIANPKIAPYGKAALEALHNAGVYPNTKNKLLYAESISQTLSYTITAADVGFIASSALYSPHMKQYQKGQHWQEINTSLYKPIDQGVVILKNGKNNPEVQAFYNFLSSSKAKKIFTSYGYQVP